MTLIVSHSIGVSPPPVRRIIIGDLSQEAAADAIQKFELHSRLIDGRRGNGEWAER